MKDEHDYRSWRDFEVSERRRVGTFQLSVDDLAKDLYVDTSYCREEEEPSDLNFDM